MLIDNLRGKIANDQFNAELSWEYVNRQSYSSLYKKLNSKDLYTETVEMQKTFQDNLYTRTTKKKIKGKKPDDTKGRELYKKRFKSLPILPDRKRSGRPLSSIMQYSFNEPIEEGIPYGQVNTDLGKLVRRIAAKRYSGYAIKNAVFNADSEYTRNGIDFYQELENETWIAVLEKGMEYDHPGTIWQSVKNHFKDAIRVGENRQKIESGAKWQEKKNYPKTAKQEYMAQVKLENDQPATILYREPGQRVTMRERVEAMTDTQFLMELLSASKKNKRKLLQLRGFNSL